VRLLGGDLGGLGQLLGPLGRLDCRLDNCQQVGSPLLSGGFRAFLMCVVAINQMQNNQKRK
jgi:hypothetical protein